MMSNIWNFIVLLLRHSPWLIMAGVAALAVYRDKTAKAAWLELVGAGSYFVLAILSWLVTWLLDWSGASVNVISSVVTIFSFLLFVALCTFAAGFCWEKLGKKKAGAGFPVVTASPVSK